MAITLPPKLQDKPLPPDKLLLLIAAIERKHKLYSIISFDEMAKQSGYAYSATSLEHTFRAFKQAAQELNKSTPVEGMVIAKTGGKRGVERDEDGQEGGRKRVKTGKEEKQRTVRKEEKQRMAGKEKKKPAANKKMEGSEGEDDEAV